MRRRSVYLVKAIFGGRVMTNFVTAEDEVEAMDKVQMELFYGGMIVQCKWLRWCD